MARNFVVGCIVLFTMAATAFSATKEPPKKLAVDLGQGVKLELVLVPAGSFTMGDEKGEPPDLSATRSGPQLSSRVHKVTITKPFYLGKYLVTQEQWQAVMGNNPSRFKGAKNPVEQVSWDDAQAFLAKLQAKAGGQSGKFVLPMEAQWEYACRAGGTGKFCFGDDEKRLGEYAWFADNSGHKTHPVGEKKPNAWGLYDMHGNVLEWCQDWYSIMEGAEAVTDPTGPETGSTHVIRGGCHAFMADSCRSAFRYIVTPEVTTNLGFRVSQVPADK